MNFRNLVASWKVYVGIVLALSIFGLLFSYLWPTSPRAELQKLSGEQMREVSGKSLINLESFDGTYSNSAVDTVCGSNQGNTCLHFKRLQMDVEGDMLASIENAVVGHYDDSGEFGDSRFGSGCGNGNSGCRSGGTSGADIRASSLGIGVDGNETVLEQPYVELAFRDFSGSKELVGFRLGAKNINGKVPFSMDTLSGAVAANHSFKGTLGAGWATFYGHREQTANIEMCCINPTGFGYNYSTGPNLADAIEFNNTEDFWVSVNKQDIMWQKNNPAINGSGRTGSTALNQDPNDFHTDGKGFWIHATDGVDATGVLNF